MGYIDSLKAAVGKWPERVAVADRNGERETTFSELDRISGLVSGKLHSLGFAKGDFVIVNMGRRMEYMASYIGILKAGCVVVPVIPDYPAERISYIISDCGARLSITPDFLSDIDVYPPYEHPAEGASPALLTYTSGSTGTPKGILLSAADIARGVTRNIALLRGIEPLTYGAATQFSFIIHVLDYLTVLSLGGAVHILSDEVRKSASSLASYYTQYGITAGVISPQVLRLFRNTDPKLRRVITVGERLSKVVPDGYELINLYSMSESVGNGTYFMVDKAYDNTPIGKAMEGLDVKVVDGEICIIGEFDTIYFGNPNRTTETFLRLDDGRTLIHTGDLGFVNENGDIVYSNRKDRMVKINGQRVEPGEIEYTMTSIDAVETAIVKGFTDTMSSSVYLVGYYKLKEGCSVDESQILDFLSGRLAPYMVPRFLCRIDAVPLNANGKPDFNALPAVDISRNAAEYSAPSTETEKTLCNAYAGVLGLKRAGLNDDFFLLGGDSIKVMKLIIECPELNLSSSIVYEGRTPRAIADMLSRVSDSFPTVAEGETVPLSSMQAGIFYECARSGWKALYNNAFLYRLGDGIDMQRLSEAVSRVVKAHPVLFASIFQTPDGTPVMKREAVADCVFPVEKVSDESVSILDESMTEMKRELLQPFSLTKDRLFRIRLFETPTRKYFFCDFHHIIFDGTSMHVFFEDLNDEYCGKGAKAEEASGFDCALAEYNVRKTEAYHKAREWYMETFSDMNAVSLPSSVLNLSQQSYDSYTLPLGIKAEDVEKWCLEKAVTPNVLTTAAFGYLLASYTADTQSCFTTVYNGRKNSRTSRTIAMLVKTLPVICNPGAAPDVHSYLKAVQTQLLGSMANDIYSFSDFAAEKNLESDIIFTYQGRMFDMPSIGGEQLVDEQLPFNATGEILSVDVIEQNGMLYFRTEYRSDLYDRQYIQRFSECYRNVLSSMMAVKSIRDISLLDSAMKESVAALSAGERLKTSEDSFVALFEKQVRKTPDNIAVADDKGSLSYVQLDRASNAVAAKLISDGVQAGDFVCITTGRSKEFLTAVLGVMKAGAAYVPVDVNYPQQRRKFMAEDSGSRLLLSDGYMSDIKPSETAVDKSVFDGPAYMIYTSGSTGTPKGVVISHSSLSNFVQSIAKLWRLSESSRIACHSSFSFDASVEDLFPALTVGGSVWIVPEHLRKDLGGLHDFIVSNGINGGCYTTQLGVSLLEFYPDLPLDYLVVGGEYLSSRPKSKCRLINTYGPTEFTVDATWKELPEEISTGIIPIGKPMPNCCAWIISPLGALMPQGLIGEICLSGPQIADGYWKRDDVTASKFREESCLPGVKLYHTGDLGRYNADGDMEFSGRMDTMVKLRGFRIETGEIDSLVSKIPGVHSCISAVKKAAGRDVLCTWIIADENVSTDSVSEKLSSSLPEYMIPDCITKLDSFPHLPNGKIDVNALSEYTSEARKKPYRAPRIGREKLLADLLSSITGIEKVGIDDDIVKDLGLSSLQMIKFVYLAEKQGIRLSISDIYRKKHIAGLLEEGGSTFYDFLKCKRPDAPIAICVCGYVPFNPYYLEMLGCMNKEYSLLVLDHFFNNFYGEDLKASSGEESENGRIISIDTLLDDYWPIVSEVLKSGKVAFVTGVCYGADIAFALMNRIEKETGMTLPLMAFDPIYDRNLRVGIPDEIRDNPTLVERYNISDALSRTMDKPHYDGKCSIFFAEEELFRKIEELPELELSAEELEEFHKGMVENEEKIRAAFPDSSFHIIPGHHYNFVNTEHMPHVLDLIRKDLQD